MKFLETIARDALNDVQSGKTVLILVPNKRAGVFLKQYFKALIDKPVFAPVILSSQEFASEISGLEDADPVELIITLYLEYLDLIKPDLSDNQTKDALLPSLGDFFGFGEVLLKDMDEIDRYCIDPETLFPKIKDIGTDSNLSDKFQKLWGNFGALYTRVREKLLKARTGTTGLKFRIASEKLQTTEKQYDTVYWAGLYALTESERRFFKLLKHHYDNDFKLYLDLDTWYCDDPLQEAGSIYRGFWKTQYHKPLPDNFRSKQLAIDVIPVQGKIGMAKCAGSILRSILNTVKAESLTSSIPSVAVIMPDESMLFPVLNSIPEEYRDVNVTMGMPFKAAKFYPFFTLVFRMLGTLMDVESPGRIYTNDLHELVHHSYFRALCEDEALEPIRAAVHEYISSNTAYIDLSDSGIFANQAEFQELFASASGYEAIKGFRKLCLKILEQYNSASFIVDSEILYQGSVLLSSLSDKLKPFVDRISIAEAQKIINSLLSGKTISFTGEPIKGLQIMGMLETQCLSFDTIIMLSANEGFLPFDGSGSSFIPELVRREAGLPTVANSDEVTAYHFYRLLSSAKQAYFIYSDANDDLGKSEASRFIQQLQFEYKAKARDWIDSHFRYPLLDTHTKSIEIPFTDTIRQILLTKKFSPSSLSSYGYCKLKFYYSHVAGLFETDEIMEDPDSAMTGEIFHKVLDNILPAGTYTQKDIQDRLQSIDEFSKQVMKQYLPHTDYTGNHYVLLDAIRKMVSTYLTRLADQLKDNTLTVLGGEKKYSMPFKLDNKTEVMVEGRIDRIDRMGDILMITDFKTGASYSASFTVDNEGQITDDLSIPRRKEALQLLCYTLLARYKHKAAETPLAVSSALYCFRSASGFVRLSAKVSKNQAFPVDDTVMRSFAEWLRNYITLILETASFTQTSERNRCIVCQYRSICLRPK